MSIKKITATLLSIIIAFSTVQVASASETNRPTIQDIYVAEWADSEGLEQGFKKFNEFLAFTEEKSKEDIDWDDFRFQYCGNGDFLVISKLWDERTYEYEKPRCSIEDRDYLVYLLSNIIGNVESSTAPDIVQIMGMYTALIRFHEDDGTFLDMYYQGDNYDTSNYNPDDELTKRAKKNARKVVDDYLEPNDDGSYSMEAPYQLYCQSQSFWGKLIMFWYNAERKEYEYFSDAGRGDGYYISYMD